MSEKKELSNEELKKVAGGVLGTKYDDIGEVNWLFTKDETVYVELTDGTKVEGKVTKRSVVGMGIAGGFDFYYIESTINTNVNGWYAGARFNKKTVSINWQVLNDYGPIEW